MKRLRIYLLSIILLSASVPSFAGIIDIKNSASIAELQTKMDAWLFSGSTRAAQMTMISQDAANWATQLATAESQMQALLEQKDIISQAYSGTKMLGQYISQIDAMGNAIQTVKGFYTTTKNSVDILTDLFNRGKISAQELALIMNQVSHMASTLQSELDFIREAFLSDTFKPKELIDYLNEFDEKANISSSNLASLITTLKRRKDALRPKQSQRLTDDLAGQADSLDAAFARWRSKNSKITEQGASSELGDDSNALFKNLSKDQKSKIINATKNKDKTVDDVKKEHFTAQKFEGFCSLIESLFALIILLYLGWSFIKLEKGNPQNQDAMKKVVMAFIFGIVFIAIFKNVIVKLLLG